jgi:hypothetical protein
MRRRDFIAALGGVATWPCLAHRRFHGAGQHARNVERAATYLPRCSAGRFDSCGSPGVQSLPAR